MPRTAPAHAGLVAFASADPLDDETMRDAPLRWPRPSRLAEPLHVAPAPAARGAEALGLRTGPGAGRPGVSGRLPARLRAGGRLPGRAAALPGVHFPDAGGDAPGGRRRLGFDELLLLQLALLRRRAVRETAAAAPALDG